MPDNIAIAIGGAKYDALTSLPCCANDVDAIVGLLTATRKFADIKSVVDGTSSDIKDQLIALISAHPDINEFFFYFTGHGFVASEEFFFCAQDFSPARPNETGFSLSRLHELLRGSHATTVAQVVDACSSGVNLIKADFSPLSVRPSAFNNFIRIASCLEGQTSLSGDPLSEFTANFVSAALSKSSGPVYYRDITDILADRYQTNVNRNPHFIFQSKGRDLFAPDATFLATLRPTISGTGTTTKPEANEKPVAKRKERSLSESLVDFEARFVSAGAAQDFINKLAMQFEQLAREENDLGEFYTFTYSANAEYYGLSTVNEEQVVRIMERQPRVDKFVTAESTYIKPKPSLGGIAGLLSGEGYTDGYYIYTLIRNCDLKNLMVRIDVKPKFLSLPAMTLQVAIIPSLDVCYVFSFASVHRRLGWEKFEENGTRGDWKWFTGDWMKGPEEIAKLSMKMLVRTAKQQLERVHTLASEGGAELTPVKPEQY